jgi:hypothetical protein
MRARDRVLSDSGYKGRWERVRGGHDGRDAGARAAHAPAVSSDSVSLGTVFASTGWRGRTLAAGCCTGRPPQAPTLNFFTPRKHTDVLKKAPTLDRTAEGGTGGDFDWSDRSRERQLYDYCGWHTTGLCEASVTPCSKAKSTMTSGPRGMPRSRCLQRRAHRALVAGAPAMYR